MFFEKRDKKNRHSFSTYNTFIKYCFWCIMVYFGWVSMSRTLSTTLFHQNCYYVGLNNIILMNTYCFPITLVISYLLLLLTNNYKEFKVNFYYYQKYYDKYVCILCGY